MAQVAAVMSDVEQLFSAASTKLVTAGPSFQSRDTAKTGLGNRLRRFHIRLKCSKSEGKRLP